jgi:plasmid stabilization system protein ParE
MEIEQKSEIIWTNIALKNIRKVHQFYIKNANKEIADKIVDELFSHVKTLEYSSLIGQTEEYLKQLNKNHHYLVLHHCKIIYRTNKNLVYITHVFDTRQNPVKLK